ncbi:MULTISPECIES: SusC/RagA family TonB-linked outer membrane protein [Bacteroides]|uniref:SusC/RagA family TonB-linked outer membrane protein n=1 Tax=Bacteroides TaxID=816 RepID=UPI00189FF237|nr:MULTISPECIES: TonB-dependent receptor [Bacteroides]MDC2611230.1 TonB-dependent receptor [Bacteroides ovatus]MDC2630452.1 TonB-dependent receptor [Bacteroides ovatus]
MLLLVSFHLNILAQEKTITGTVFDKAGETVIGASILVKGTVNGIITDVDGGFTLNNVPDDAILQISFVGYKPQNVAVKGQSHLKIILEEDTEVLDEVVVIGYGSVRKSSLTGAVAKMDKKGIQDRPLARPETALQGQLAGVTVRTTNGEPGADMQIRVRGAASVNANSDPLYVVDGVPLNTLSGINPADIASIEVLKDAASSAIYGSRGSNGVVIVTTQKGNVGKPKVSFNASVGFQTLEKKIDLLSAAEWMEFRTKWNDANYLATAQKKGIANASVRDDNATRLANVGIKAGTDDSYLYILDNRWFNYLSEDMKASHTYTTTPEKLSLLDWQDEVYRLAVIQDYSLSVSGATDNVNYLFSGGYLSQEGLATGTDYERFSFRANVESKINKYFSIGMNLAPTYIVTNGSGRANGKDSQAHKTLSSCPVSEPGVGYMTYVQPNDRYGWADTTSSPSYILNTDINQNRTLRMVGNAFLRITPFQDFRIELSAAANYYDVDGNKYSFSSSGKSWAKGEGQSSSGSHSTSRIWSTLLQAVANYDHTFGKHGVSAMLGFSSEQSSLGYKTEQGFKGPFPNDAIIGSFDGSKVAVGTNTVTEQTPNKLLSTFGRLQYNYDDRYMVSGSLRFDGGSVFGANNKWGVFPAVSGGWIVSNEKFFKNWEQKWWNTLKVRGSYGVTGNNSISNTAAYATLASAVYGGASGFYTNSLGNPDLGWEKTHSTDIAVDLGFLNNRIQLSLDWYTKNTTDLLYQVPVEGASGFSTIWDNLGDIHNEGFEIELNTHNLTGTFKWDTSFNMSYNKNEVKKLGTDNTPIFSGFSGSNYSNILTVGKAVNTYYMYEAVGVWKNQAEIDAYSADHDGKPVTFEGKKIQPGDIRYRDVNNDGKYDKDNDRDYLGSPTPKFVFGMTNRFSYKNFDVSILLTAQTGGKIYGILGRAIDRPSMGAKSNIMGHWRDAWWSEDELGNGSVPYILSQTTGTTLDSRWLYSSNYLRIKNLTVGYKLPINPRFISFARVYLSIENLAKWDNYYGGYSPEAANVGSGPGGASALGLDYGGYPSARTFTLGINVNF